jgi:hypothetical protein
LWKNIVAEAALAKQDSVFLAREIEALDEVDPTRHTPGVELLFDAPVSGPELEARLAELKKYDVEYLTVMVGGEPKTPGAMSDAIGIRMLHMPEFERRYGGDDDLLAMDDATLGDYIEARARAMTEQVHEVVSKIPGMTGRVGWFDTNTAFLADYGRVLGDGSDVQPAGVAEDGAGAAGGEVWRGQQVRERLAAADRQVAYLAQREADAGGGDAGPAGDTFNQSARASDELIFQQAGSRVLQRTPELQEAARAVAAGEMTPEAYTALVERYKPVTPYADVPEPASVEDMQRALTSDKVGRIGATDQLEAGHKVGLRLDIPDMPTTASG